MSVNNDGGQLEMVISPLIFALSGFRGGGLPPHTDP